MFMRIYYYIRLILFTTAAILIGVFSHQLLDYLNYLVGGVMIAFGFEGLFFPFMRSKNKFFAEYQFFLGFIEVLLGILVLTVVRDFNNICMIWATWTIVRESFELYETMHKFLHKFPAVLSFVLSIIEIMFSILLIVFASEHHALTHIYLLIPEFVIYAISPLLFYIYSRRTHKE